MLLYCHFMRLFKPFSIFIDRPTVREKIDLHIYHGGRITLEPTLSYDGGSVESFRGWDIDVISSLVVGKFVKSIGYHGYKSLWYRHPSVEGSTIIRPLIVMKM